MEELLEFMYDQYRKTRWPYFGLNPLIYRFGKDTRKHLNTLFKQGVIEKREGANYPLVKLVKLPD